MPISTTWRPLHFKPTGVVMLGAFLSARYPTGIRGISLLCVAISRQSRTPTVRLLQFTSDDAVVSHLTNDFKEKSHFRPILTSILHITVR